jgi:hypothetical protein
MMVLKKGKDYTSPERRKALVELAVNWVESTRNKYTDEPYCDRYLDQLINTEEMYPGFGFAEAIEDQSGYVHCLCTATVVENWWHNRCDVNITAMLINKKCNPKYPNVLLDRLEKWSAKREAQIIQLYSWSNRKGYHRAMERIGFEPFGYIYARKIQNEN